MQNSAQVFPFILTVLELMGWLHCTVVRHELVEQLLKKQNFPLQHNGTTLLQNE